MESDPAAKGPAATSEGASVCRTDALKEEIRE
jgi:hypothetical protein